MAKKDQSKLNQHYNDYKIHKNQILYLKKTGNS